MRDELELVHAQRRPSLPDTKPWFSCLSWVRFSLAGATKPPTLAEARTFIERAQSKLLDFRLRMRRADWVKSTFITDDTEILAAKVIKIRSRPPCNQPRRPAASICAENAEDLARQFLLLRLSLTLAAPSDRSPRVDAGG